MTRHLALALTLGLSLYWHAKALACDASNERSDLVGKSATSLLFRVENADTGAISLEVESFVAGESNRSIPIVTENDPVAERPKLRKARWKAAEKSLKAEGFVIDPDLVQRSSLRLTQTEKGDDVLELPDGSRLVAVHTTKTLKKKSQDGYRQTAHRTDLVWQKGKRRKVLIKELFADVQAENEEFGVVTTIGRGYYFADQDLLVLFTGSCLGASTLVFTLKDLFAESGK